MTLIQKRLPKEDVATYVSNRWLFECNNAFSDYHGRHPDHVDIYSCRGYRNMYMVYPKIRTQPNANPIPLYAWDEDAGWFAIDEWPTCKRLAWSDYNDQISTALRVARPTTVLRGRIKIIQLQVMLELVRDGSYTNYISKKF